MCVHLPASGARMCVHLSCHLQRVYTCRDEFDSTLHAYFTCIERGRVRPRSPHSNVTTQQPGRGALTATTPPACTRRTLTHTHPHTGAAPQSRAVNRLPRVSVFRAVCGEAPCHVGCSPSTPPLPVVAPLPVAAPPYGDGLETQLGSAAGAGHAQAFTCCRRRLQRPAFSEWRAAPPRSRCWSDPVHALAVRTYGSRGTRWTDRGAGSVTPRC